MEGDADQDGNFRFYHPSEEFIYDANRFWDKLQCFEDEPVIQGDFNAAAAKQLVIRFDICRGDKKCKDEAVIK